jgi:hypothetical protein
MSVKGEQVQLAISDDRDSLLLAHFGNRLQQSGKEFPTEVYRSALGFDGFKVRRHHPLDFRTARKRNDAGLFSRNDESVGPWIGKHVLEHELVGVQCLSQPLKRNRVARS